MARIKIGDFFEIETPKGKAYMQYVHKDDSMGFLVKILDGFYQEIPKNLGKLVTSNERFLIYFPLSAAYNRKIVKLVGHMELGDFVQPKYMRSMCFIDKDSHGWEIVDTQTSKRRFIEKLTKAEKELSPYAIWNDTLLIDRLASGWSLDDWV
ncbi:MAG: hypothetical protein KDD94_02415 [Calditrichaeota bacterium]|nr:hypothetical protein [Calditrichota bacterium]